MSGPLLALVGAIYCWVAGNYLRAGDIGMFIVFVGYALGNLGFIIKGSH